MTPHEELELLKSDPESLLVYYMDMITNGQSLSFEQLIKFEYLKSLFIRED